MITKTVKLSGGDYSNIMDALADSASFINNPMIENVEIIVDNDISDNIEVVPGMKIPFPFIQENNGFTLTIKRAE
jgi:hypothetical protein